MVETLEESPTVLIVDDEAGMVELISAYLNPYCETRTATGGTDALELIDDSIDIAIVDRRMPGKTGNEVLEELRAEGYRFPVAMLTAVQADVDIIEMPFDVYLTKPVSRDELLNVVEVLVRLQDYDEKSREFLPARRKETVPGGQSTSEYGAW